MLLATLRERPLGETDFAFEPYRREIRRCLACRVFFNAHDMIPDDFYEGTYNASSPERLAERFQRIIRIPLESSDNKNRVQRIIHFLSERGSAIEQFRVLDVGSGTGVFPYELAQHGIRCACVDPDPQAVAHARQFAGVEAAYVGSVSDIPPEERFDLVTLNKVLEHVQDPISLLSQAGCLLTPAGFVYVELPEGERSVTAGTFCERAEFFVEHITVYNESSLALLVDRAGLETLKTLVYTDPSGKLSICAFCRGRG